MADRMVDLLRHGEVQGGGRFRGSHDDPLTVDGWSQMRAAVAAAQCTTWDCILYSPATRCAAFARQLAEQRGLPATAISAFRERDFGAWEGLSAEQIPIEDLSRFWADPLGYDPPNAESFADFHERISQGWRELLADDLAHPLIVTHGGVVRVIVGEVLGLRADRLLLLEVPTACSTRLRVPTGGWRPSLISHGHV
ncbi:MAG: histidine phosphatase family protein [Thiohalocapsa sp.]